MMTAPLVEMGTTPRLVGVLQLRTRLWHERGLDVQSDKCDGFCDKECQ